MTKEEIQLLITDLAARLPYGVKVYAENIDLNGTVAGIGRNETYLVEYSDWWDIEFVKPYLIPMSSMTKEELKEYYIIAGIGTNPVVWNKPQPDWHFSLNDLDWLYQHHFDVRGLISMGLAIEAPADMYL